MKAQFLNRSIENHSSISVQSHPGKFFKKLWHYHPEIELMFIKESCGSAFIGDNIQKFEPGDLFLVGQNLPHLWQNDSEYFYHHSSLKANCITIHFKHDFIQNLPEIPEFKDIYELIQRAKFGIKFGAIENNIISEKINSLLDLTSYDRLIEFLEILKMLASQTEYSLLASIGFMDSFNDIRNSKILPVFEYVMNNFKNPISLDHVAGLANMNPSAFSRYFSSVQKKTFTQYVNEIRIGYACKLLMGGDHNIAEACFASGFNNLSNFNKHFRSIKKVAPSVYLKLYSKL